LKVKFTRVFGWYIEVSRSQLAKAPGEWRRKQTVAQFGDPDPEYAKRTGGAEHLMHGGTGVSGA
jgi:hypothetical protein